MKQQLVRLLFPYGSERRVLRGPARGMRFVVEPGIGFTYALGTDAARTQRAYDGSEFVDVCRHTFHALRGARA